MALSEDRFRNHLNTSTAPSVATPSSRGRRTLLSLLSAGTDVKTLLSAAGALREVRAEQGEARRRCAWRPWFARLVAWRGTVLPHVVWPVVFAGACAAAAAQAQAALKKQRELLTLEGTKSAPGELADLGLLPGATEPWLPLPDKYLDIVGLAVGFLLAMQMQSAVAARRQCAEGLAEMRAAAVDAVLHAGRQQSLDVARLLLLLFLCVCRDLQMSAEEYDASELETPRENDTPSVKRTIWRNDTNRVKSNFRDWIRDELNSIDIDHGRIPQELKGPREELAAKFTKFSDREVLYARAYDPHARVGALIALASAAGAPAKDTDRFLAAWHTARRACYSGDAPALDHLNLLALVLIAAYTPFVTVEPLGWLVVPMNMLAAVALFGLQRAAELMRNPMRPTDLNLSVATFKHLFASQLFRVCWCLQNEAERTGGVLFGVHTGRRRRTQQLTFSTAPSFSRAPTHDLSTASAQLSRAPTLDISLEELPEDGYLPGSPA